MRTQQYCDLRKLLGPKFEMRFG